MRLPQRAPSAASPLEPTFITSLGASSAPLARFALLERRPALPSSRALPMTPNPCRYARNPRFQGTRHSSTRRGCAAQSASAAGAGASFELLRLRQAARAANDATRFGKQGAGLQLTASGRSAQGRDTRQAQALGPGGRSRHDARSPPPPRARDALAETTPTHTGSCRAKLRRRYGESRLGSQADKLETGLIRFAHPPPSAEKIFDPSALRTQLPLRRNSGTR